MDTGKGVLHTGLLEGIGERALGEIPNVDDGVMDAANHHGTCIMYNKPARSAHVPQNLRYNFKKGVFVELSWI